MPSSDTDTGPGRRYQWLRYAPPAAALSVAWFLQVIVVTDVLGTAVAQQLGHVGPSWWWYCAAAVFGVAVATSLEAGAAYLMALYDRHLLARDSVWQLRIGMVVYVAVSAFVIHWWLGYRGLPEVTAVVLGGMSASALWLWSRGARWAQRREMVAAGQIDQALPRLPAVSKVMHPIRWLVTLYLISWEPVQTTDQARERYALWKHRTQRSSTSSTTSTARAAGVGSSRPVSGSGTTTSRRREAASRRGAGASTATTSRAGGSTSTGTNSRSGVGSGRRGATLDEQKITRLASTIYEQSWTNATVEDLASRLSVSKSYASPARNLAREWAKRNGHSPQVPASTSEPVA